LDNRNNRLMDSSLERNSFMESSQSKRKAVVCYASYNKYYCYIRNFVYLYFQQKERIQESKGRVIINKKIKNMSLISWMNEKIKKLDWIDMGLTKTSCFAFGIILARLIPCLLGINIWWIIAAWVILAARPMYRFFSK